ncbi:MAG TPA: hypothetical protein VF533_16835 [Solirubrobacteraceae bacterium]|jgi:hypothetical protein
MLEIGWEGQPYLSSGPRRGRDDTTFLGASASTSRAHPTPTVASIALIALRRAREELEQRGRLGTAESVHFLDEAARSGEAAERARALALASIAQFADLARGLKAELAAGSERLRRAAQQAAASGMGVREIARATDLSVGWAQKASKLSGRPPKRLVRDAAEEQLVECALAVQDLKERLDDATAGRWLWTHAAVLELSISVSNVARVARLSHQAISSEINNPVERVDRLESIRRLTEAATKTRTFEPTSAADAAIALGLEEQLNVADPATFLATGSYHWTQGRGEEARRYWKRAADLDHPCAAHFLGLVSSYDQDPAEAERWWRRAAQMGHGHRGAHLLGDLLHDQGRCAEALKAWQEAAALGDGASASCLGHHAHHRQPDVAVAWYRRALALGEPHAATPLLELVEEPSERQRALRRATELGCANLAFLLYVEMQDDPTVGAHELEAALRRAYKLGSSEAGWRLGQLLIERGQHLEGRRALRTAAKQGLGDASCLLGLNLMTAEEPEAAIAAFERAVELDHDHVLEFIAPLRLAEGDEEAAYATWREAAARGYSNALRVLALIRTELGDPEAAAAELRAAHAKGWRGATAILAEHLVTYAELREARRVLAEGADAGDTDAIVALHALDMDGSPDDTQVRDAAVAAWTRVAEREKAPTALLNLGRLAESEERWADAVHWYRRADDFVDASHELSYALARDGQIEDAVAFATSAAEEGWSGAALFLGERELEAGREDTAEMWLKRAADDWDVDAMVSLSDLLIRLGRTREALAYMQRAHSLSERDVRPGLGLALAAHGRIDEANEIWRAGWAAGDPHCAINLGAAVANEQVTDPETLREAEAALRYALEQGISEAAPPLGWVLVQLDRESEAVELFSSCPTDVNSRFWLGCHELDLGHHAAGERYLRDAHDAGHSDALLVLGLSLAERGSADGPQLLREAADAGDAKAMLAIGTLYCQQDDFASAEPWLKRARRRGLPMAAFLLGRHWIWNDEPRRGRGALEEAHRRGVTKAATYLGLDLIDSDEEAAERWLRLAGEEDPWAAWGIGVLLKDRDNESQEALRLALKADEAGHPLAPALVGDLRLRAADREGAARAYRRGALRGDAYAAETLAHLMDRTMAVPRNIVMQHYAVAHTLGSECAAFHLNHLNALYNLATPVWRVTPLAVLRPLARPIVRCYRLWRGRSSFDPQTQRGHAAVDVSLRAVSFSVAVSLGFKMRTLPGPREIYYPPPPVLGSRRPRAALGTSRLAEASPFNLKREAA